MGLREAERIFKVISRPVYSLRGAVSVIRSLRSIAFDDCEIDRFDQTSPKYAQNQCVFSSRVIVSARLSFLSPLFPRA